MAIAKESALEELFLEKAEIQRLVDDLHRALGIADDPTATAQKARDRMRASGIRPEENEFSRAIIAARKE